jgi:hypothetical protein
MTDLFGQVAECAPFKDIRNQRESVAEEKARLCQDLNALLRATPKSLGVASIQRVREFKVEHKRCLKVLQSKTSSRQELESAINSMKGW